MRLRVHPVRQLYNGWNVQQRKWWGWATLSRWPSSQEAEGELSRMDAALAEKALPKKEPAK
jgi:hypothetical protein